MKTINYYQPVIRPIAKNGSERLGVNAVTQIWDIEKPNRKMELSVFGKSTDEALENLKRTMVKDSQKDNFQSVEVECSYFLCTKEVVEVFKPFELSKPFLDYIDADDDSSEHYVAWLNFAEVEKYYNEKESKIDEEMISFWLQECVPGTMDVSKVSMRQAKQFGLFREIEDKLLLTVARNRAMTICNLSQRFNCNPIQLVNKYL